ncbi:hypothetical protein [Streptomonospora nanhaiensis]|uniref:Lipopolysaccharide export LptBFGC system permease protein LptF n=1 Tax=Streptomonospora nanhaiensis TaxID=1323731 RepID=A0A853BTB4_9ACTN|nr:hypothetical protein [Streptomonospora nanhaiensis]MBV2365377.1 hypothetical protein [Streptomonospora nanhaiensis]NYI99029.1 lipopolysaccharide export LptBFGC system permease protein LptF [Streptomonospora nanhaiensis]
MAGDQGRGMLSLGADLFGVVTTPAAVVIAVVAFLRSPRPDSLGPELLPALLGVFVVGIVLTGVGVARRLGFGYAFEPDRGLAATVLLLLGTAFTLGALAAYLLLR